jgi:8-oxo-dGTP diphosphatase
VVVVVVDAANVMGSRPDGWWRDRAGAAVRLHADLAHLAAGEGVRIAGHEAMPAGFVLVLEGAARGAMAHIEGAGAPGAFGSSADLAGLASAAAPGAVCVVLAPGSGDDTIVAAVSELSGSCLVVTADRELRRRCEALGASVMRPGWLLGQFGARR